MKHPIGRDLICAVESIKLRLDILCAGDTPRFGPGRFSRRHHQTKRLRELRARRSTASANGLRDGIRLSWGPSGGIDFPKPRTGGTTREGTRGSKRQRASAGGTYQIENDTSQPEHSAAIVQTILEQPEATTFKRTMGRSRNTVQHPLRGEDECPKDYGGGWSRGISGLNEALTGQTQPPGTTEDVSGCRRINVSIPPLGSLDDGPNVFSGFTNTPGTNGQAATAEAFQVVPVRSAPVSWKPLAATSSGSLLTSSGCRKTPPVNEKRVQQRKTRTQNSVDPSISVAARVADRSAAGDVVGASWEPTFDWSDVKANGTVGDVRASHDKNGDKSPSVLAESRPEYPGIADSCGGVVLRLTPGERSIEPWGNTLAPLRAMCDIDPSLSRAGMEYRGVIHAVEGVKEMKFHHQIKVNHGNNVGNSMQSGRPQPLYSLSVLMQYLHSRCLLSVTSAVDESRSRVVHTMVISRAAILTSSDTDI